MDNHVHENMESGLPFSVMATRPPRKHFRTLLLPLLLLVCATPCEAQTSTSTVTSTTSVSASPSPSVYPYAVSQVSCGASFTCVLLSVGGGVQCFGLGANGQLGNGNAYNVFGPPLTNVLTNVIAVSASFGSSFTCVLLATSGVRCWGSNAAGQLGTGGTNALFSPPSTDCVTGVSLAATGTLATGLSNTCVVLSNSGVLCWGSNSGGMIGNGYANGTSITTPIPANAVLFGVVSVTVGQSHVCVVTNTTGLRCWGANGSGQLGNGYANATNIVSPPVNDGITGVAQVVAGVSHTCILLSANGGVRCFGAGGSGQLGLGSTVSQYAILATNVVLGATFIAAGYDTSCAVMTNSSLLCWGQNTYAQVGIGTISATVNSPTVVSGLGAGVAFVSSGQFHSCALLVNGTAQCWGYDGSGQVGNNVSVNVLTPPLSDLPGLPLNAVQISAGNLHTCVLLSSTGVRCWGGNNNGQIAQPSTVLWTTTPPAADQISSVSQVSCGQYHTCLLMSSTTGVRCFGYNANGQLGINSSTTVWTIPSTDVLTGVTQVSAAATFTCVLMNTTGVRCWGANTYGQLGNGYSNSTNVLFPPSVDIPGLLGVTQVDTGVQHVCVLMASTGFRCWGSNGQGQGGLGYTNASYITSPPTVDTVVGFLANSLSLGSQFTCAAFSNLSVSCWGYNSQGQLGIGSTTTTTRPSSTTIVTPASQVCAGYAGACALTTTGGVQCWGYNNFGQVGNGNEVQINSPSGVVLTGASQLACGLYSTCVIMNATGGVRCWGENDYGGSGDGVTLVYTTPVPVDFPVSPSSSPTPTTSATTSPTSTVTQSVTVSATVTTTGSVSASETTTSTVSSTTTPTVTVSSTVSPTLTVTTSCSVTTSTSASPTLTATATQSTTATVSATVTTTTSTTTTGSTSVTITSTITPSASGSGTSTVTASDTVSVSSSATTSSSASRTITITPSFSASSGSSVSNTPSESSTVTVSSSASTTVSSSTSVTSTATSSGTVTVTLTDTVTVSTSTSVSVTLTSSASGLTSPSVTATTSASASSTSTGTPTLTRSSSASASASESPTATSSSTLTASPSGSTTRSSSRSRTDSRSSSESPSPTETVPSHSPTSSTSGAAGPPNINCVVASEWTDWSPCVGNSSCAITGFSVRTLSILVFQSGHGTPCPPVSELQVVQQCNVNVSSSCTECAGSTCGAGSNCGLCNQGQTCTTGQDCAADLVCALSNTCISSVVSSSTVYDSFSLQLAGVSSAAFRNSAVSSALISAVVNHVLLLGSVSISDSMVTILHVNDTILSTPCTIQVNNSAPLVVNYGVVITLLIQAATLASAADLSVAIGWNSVSLSREVQQSVSQVLPGICSVLPPQWPASIITSNQQPLVPPSSSQAPSVTASSGGRNSGGGVPIIYVAIGAGAALLITLAIVGVAVNRHRKQKALLRRKLSRTDHNSPADVDASSNEILNVLRAAAASKKQEQHLEQQWQDSPLAPQAAAGGERKLRQSIARPKSSAAVMSPLLHTTVEMSTVNPLVAREHNNSTHPRSVDNPVRGVGALAMYSSRAVKGNNARQRNTNNGESTAASSRSQFGPSRVESRSSVL